MAPLPARLLTVLLALLALPCVVGAQAPRPALVFGGDREFPPYEFLDEGGAPQGFNVQLIRALAREAAIEVEVRLEARERRMADFEQGRTDVMFMAATPEREGRYQLLDQTWTLSQVVLMRPGLNRYPRSVNDLWGFRIAVDRDSINHQLLEALPPPGRPALTVVATRAEAVGAFTRGEVDGVAGNHLTMGVLVSHAADTAVEVLLTSRPYHLAVMPGREEAVEPLRAALVRLRQSGEFDRLVEHYLTLPREPSWLDRYAPALGAGAPRGGGGLVGGRGGGPGGRPAGAGGAPAGERTERRFRDLVENASDMIYRTDPVGRFIFVNPVAVRTLGYTEAELLSMKYFELMRQDWVPRAMAFYQESARSTESTYLEIPVRTKDGRELWVGQHVRPIRAGGRMEGFQGVARDITDRVRAQADLQAERDFVSAILDTAPVLVMVLDAQGAVARFNRACEALAGVTADQVVGRPIWETSFLLDEDRLAIREGLGRLVAATSPVIVDRVWVDARGGRHLVSWTVIALRDQAGQTTYLIGVGSDVTASREIEKLKSQFVSMVSHELRTPLTSIRASMQLVLAEGMTAASPDADRLVHVALTNADRLIRIVNDILDMSKIEAGELLVTPLRASAAAIVDDSVRSVDGVARDAGVTLHIDPAIRALPDVLADPDRTVQVLVNLISNAVKHAPAGSAVDIGGRVAGPTAVLSVRDHGPGIPAHKLNFIFEPFTQLDGSDSRRVPGTGLGLTIARALAERQGGTVHVESVEGKGATFSLTLPLATS